MVGDVAAVVVTGGCVVVEVGNVVAATGGRVVEVGNVVAATGCVVEVGNAVAATGGWVVEVGNVVASEGDLIGTVVDGADVVVSEGGLDVCAGEDPEKNFGLITLCQSRYPPSRATMTIAAVLSMVVSFTTVENKTRND